MGNNQTASRITDHDGLVSMLVAACLSGSATIVTIDAEVEPDMRKTGNPFLGRVKKVSRVNGFLGFDYASTVNRQREREGAEADFQAEPRKWGKRVKGTPFVVHKGRVYLEMKVQKAMGTTYLLDGRPATDAEVQAIKAFIPTRTEGARQEVDRPVVLRDYKLDSVKGISCFGEAWAVLAPSADEADLRVPVLA